MTTATRPALTEVVADWLWNAFYRPGGHPLAVARDRVRACASDETLPRCFVLHADGVPVGTASLTAQDLEERPDLSPWLAGVFVLPSVRGRGYAGRLIAAVEAAARAGGAMTLWLYTDTAERVYSRAGWRTVETVEHHSRTRPGVVKPVSLMRRDLPPETGATYRRQTKET